MATSNQLRAWTSTLRGLAPAVDNKAGSVVPTSFKESFVWDIVDLCHLTNCFALRPGQQVFRCGCHAIADTHLPAIVQAMSSRRPCLGWRPLPQPRSPASIATRVGLLARHT
jgi:hypothetical protein